MGGKKVSVLRRTREGKDWGMITNLFERTAVKEGGEREREREEEGAKKDRKIGAAKSKGIPRGVRARD